MTSRTIKFSKTEDIPGAMGGATRRQDNKLVVPMYSGFFSSLTDNVMCTNAMYDGLRKEIEGTLSLYSPKEDIVLTVFESAKSSDDVRESVIIGFKRYITEYKRKATQTFKCHLFLFPILFLIGVLMEFLLYGVFPGLLPLWIQNTLDIIIWVFVWQFAAYMTFEFTKEKSSIKRLEQALRTEFVFRHWE